MGCLPQSALAVQKRIQSKKSHKEWILKNFDKWRKWKDYFRYKEECAELQRLEAQAWFSQ